MRSIVWIFMVLVMTSLSCFAMEKQKIAKEHPVITGIMQESLLDASPSGLNLALRSTRAAFLDDPDSMFDYVLAIRLLIRQGLELVDQNPDLANEYRKVLSSATYNLAADTWPGWADANPRAEEFRSIGMDAARLNLRLRVALDQKPAAQSRGHWIVGAHLIAAGQYPEAIAAFESCRDLAREDGESVIGFQGWIHLTNILAGRDESEQLEQIKKQLINTDEDGAFYAAQFDSAIAIFQE